MNLLVTGGCGFIGSSFIRQRLHEPSSSLAKLVNLDALTYAGNPANVAEIAGDPRYVFTHGSIADAALVTRLLATHEIDAVVNFAAESHVDRSIASPDPFVQTNVAGTLCLLECARRHWVALPGALRASFRFLHVSTDEVYGALAPDAPAFTEESPFAPNSPYAASKAAADHFVRAYYQTHCLPTLTANCSNNYGPFQFPEKLIPLMMVNALAGRALPIYGDGRQVRDWLHVKDNCDAIWLTLRHGRLGGTYNIGGGTELTNLAVVQNICTLLDEKSPRPDGRTYAAQIVHVTDRPGHDRRYALNCDKIRRELGWTPQVDLNEGFRQTVTWYLDNEVWLRGLFGRAQIHGPLRAGLRETD